MKYMIIAYESPQNFDARGKRGDGPEHAPARLSALQDDAAFNAVVSAFADDGQVRPPKSGPRFGDRRALKVNGKIFAMMSSKGHFVVKLSKERVRELAGAGRGVPFDLGNGRLMKQWLVVTAGRQFWIPLAREARQLVV
jgi:hypothetical protein